MADEKQDQPISILAPGLPNPARKPRQIFVAYSYRLYPKDDYRRVYNELKRAFQVDFVFADEKITSPPAAFVRRFLPLMASARASR